MLRKGISSSRCDGRPVAQSCAGERVFGKAWGQAAQQSFSAGPECAFPGSLEVTHEIGWHAVLLQGIP